MVRRDKNLSFHPGRAPGVLAGLEAPTVVVRGAEKWTPAAGATPVGRRTGGPIELLAPVCGRLRRRLVDRGMLDLLVDMGSCASLGAEKAKAAHQTTSGGAMGSRERGPRPFL